MLLCSSRAAAWRYAVSTQQAGMRQMCSRGVAGFGAGKPTDVAVDKATAIVQVAWADGTSSRFHARWLAENCASRRQGVIAGPQKLPLPEGRSERIVGVSLDCEGNQDDPTGVRLKWACGHESHFCGDWLRAHCYSPESNRQRKKQRDPLAAALRADDAIPYVEYNDVMASEEGVLSWTQQLERTGICVIRGVPSEEGEVSRLAAQICPPMYTLYGYEWNVRSKNDPINVAYTTKGLEAHQDLAYYESPPGIQMLHCLAFGAAVTGGDSYFYDTFVLAELLRQKNPTAFETLSRVPATFQTDHMDRDYPAQMFYSRPHISISGIDERGMPMVSGVFWAGPFEGTLLVEEADVEQYYEAYDAFAELMSAENTEVAEKWRVRLRLQEGECVTFNQRRLLHGREAFTLNGDERHLQGCYLNIDDFLNRHRALSVMRGGATQGLDTVIRAGNSSWS